MFVVSMKIKLLLIGKTKKDFLIEGEKEYEKRLGKYISFSEEVIPELKIKSSLSFEEVKKREGELILKKIDSTDFVVLLDENGKEYNSVEFSNFIDKKLNMGTRNLVFIVGGAYGFSNDVYQRGNQKIALSKMTFSHQMVRMIFKEQLYRAYTILNNEPYHHA